MVLQIVQYSKYCYWNCHSGNNYVSWFYHIHLDGRLRWSSLEILWHKSANQCSLEDRDKQQISFFVMHFTVRYSDWLVTTAMLKVLDGSGICPPVTVALEDPCAICVFFWTPRNLFYITHSSSVHFLTLFKLTKN